MGGFSKIGSAVGALLPARFWPLSQIMVTPTRARGDRRTREVERERRVMTGDDYPIIKEQGGLRGKTIDLQTSPFIVDVEVANFSASMPRFWSMER